MISNAVEELQRKGPNQGLGVCGICRNVEPAFEKEIRSYENPKEANLW